MKDGLLPVVAIAGGVAAVVVWSMSAQDPYWRLFETPSVPAPAYDRPEDLRAVLASVTPDYGNADAGAASPAADPVVSAMRANIPLDTITIAREAETAAVSEPMIALVPPLEPVPMTGPAIDQMIASRLTRTAIPVPAGFAPDTFETAADLAADFALAPTPMSMPVPVVWRDPGTGAVAQAVVGAALNPFNAPAPPAQPRVAASQLTEDALALERAGRIDVQRRLALAGFDPSGLDGAFGPRTRGAIADFQAAWGFPATGYLEAAVHADLNQRTEDAYQALRRQAAAAPSAAPELAPIARERQFASAGDDGGCARRSDGRIIERQSFGCDLAGFGEQFVSLGRNMLNDEGDGEDDDTLEVAAHTPRIAAPDADR
ncbi:MAG: peptidoglycan-binding domain-containing protein [Alphaproteobacteria bacterium]